MLFHYAGDKICGAGILVFFINFRKHFADVNDHRFMVLLQKQEQVSQVSDLHLLVGCIIRFVEVCDLEKVF